MFDVLDPGTLQLHTPKNASRELIFPTATIARRVTLKVELCTSQTPPM
jgi:hypothetical protein